LALHCSQSSTGFLLIHTFAEPNPVDARSTLQPMLQHELSIGYDGGMKMKIPSFVASRRLAALL
jgi:hypothetical protein